MQGLARGVVQRPGAQACAPPAAWAAPQGVGALRRRCSQTPPAGSSAHPKGRVRPAAPCPTVPCPVRLLPVQLHTDATAAASASACRAAGFGCENGPARSPTAPTPTQTRTCHQSNSSSSGSSGSSRPCHQRRGAGSGWAPRAACLSWQGLGRAGRRWRAQLLPLQAAAGAALRRRRCHLAPAPAPCRAPSPSGVRTVFIGDWRACPLSAKRQRWQPRLSSSSMRRRKGGRERGTTWGCCWRWVGWGAWADVFGEDEVEFLWAA